MSKTRRNESKLKINLEKLCLICGTNGFTKNIAPTGLYEIYEDECIICKKITKHIKCKNIDKLKAELIFLNEKTQIDKEILNLTTNDKSKLKIKY